MKIRMTADMVREAERYLGKQDAVMKGVIAEHGPCPLGQGRPDYFDTLAWSIVSQQLSVKAAQTIGKRLLDLIDEPKMHARKIASLKQTQLRAVGLSNNKANFMLSLADEMVSGRLNFRSLAQKSDEQVIERLVQLKGIGVWTAEMFLMFALRRPDVASPADIGLQRAMLQLYNLRKKPTSRTFELSSLIRLASSRLTSAPLT